LTRDAQGREVGMISDAGAKKVAPLWSIRIRDVQPINSMGLFEPVRKDLDDGAFSLAGSCIAYCGLTDTEARINATRASNEDFIGRVENDRDEQGKIVKRTINVADLAYSVMTLLHTKAVRGFAGLHRVPAAELADAWAGTWKKLENCTRGHGYGTSTDRKAQRIADPSIKEAVLAFSKEVMAAVGGDDAAAKQILKDCTSQTASADGKRKAFAGHDSFLRIVEQWQLDRALAAWLKHPMHPHNTEPGSNG
jgi:hypothetical protein